MMETENSNFSEAQTQTQVVPTLALHYAGFWIRAVAYLIDAVILNAVSWLLELAIIGAIYWVAILMNRDNQADFEAYLNPMHKQMVFLAISSVIELIYYTVGHHRYGTTVGKRIFQIYVVDISTLGYLSLWKSFIRAIGTTISAVIFGAGYLMAAFHPKKRALHDLMAGSISVIGKPHV
jgi:uncharacterized RDD family membrane protein YckC